MKYIATIVALLWTTIVYGQTPTIGAPNASVIEGTLSQVSKLPVAETNPYPDCYYTAVVDIDHIASGQGIPKRVVLVLPGFFSRRYAPEAKYKTGDKVRATLVPFASMPDKVKQTQQADEIEEVDLGIYFPQKITLIQEFHKAATSVPFAVNDVSSQKATETQKIDLGARDVRKQQIQRDLKDINTLLAKHGRSWDKWYKSLASFRSKYKKQYDAKSERWVSDSFFSAGQLPDDKAYSTGFVKSIIALKNYLSRRNIDLILVRVPTKGEVAADLFAPLPSDKVQNPYLLRMYKELLEADVEIVTDIIPKAREQRLKYPLMYWYQDFAEIHPAEGIAWVVADELAQRVSRYSRVQSLQRNTLTLKDESHPYNDFKWPKGNPKFSSEEYVHFSAVTDATGAPLQLGQGAESPVLMVGSSFLAFPSFTKGASIPHYFAYLSGVSPDLLRRSGGDRTVLRNIAREGDAFLQNRTVCLFPFTPELAYLGVAPLPLFDPYQSEKTQVGEYSGADLKEAISITLGPQKGAVSYPADGTLCIEPVGNHGAAAKFRVKVPEEVSKFPYFIVEVGFASKDLTEITTTYSGQTDKTIKSDTQPKNYEAFIFSTKKSKTLELDFAGNSGFRRPIVVNRITFFGVNKPAYYQEKR